MNIFDIMQSLAKGNKIVIVEDIENSIKLSFDFNDEEEEHIAFSFFANANLPVYSIKTQGNKSSIRTKLYAEMAEVYTSIIIENIFSKAV